MNEGLARSLGAAAWVICALLSLPTVAVAQTGETRPSDSDIFGPADKPAADKPAEPEGDKPASPADAPAPAPAAPPDPAHPAAAPPANTTPAPADPSAPVSEDAARDAAMMGDPNANLGRSEDAAPDDPLRLGGMFYWRTLSSARQEQAPKDWTFSAPAVLDVYMDARPNDRVRAFARGRMAYDSTRPEVAPSSSPSAGGGAPGGMSTTMATGDTMGSDELASLLGAGTSGPRVVLDQLWLRFDIDRTIFVTAGKQHVRWGAGRFWAPGDYLHIRRRNPLDVFDARTGTTMLKLHLPWESTGWNFYAYTLLEDPDSIPRLSDLAAAARAEIVLGTNELGAGILAKSGQLPKASIDLSTGIWDFDVYGEVALRAGSEIDRVQYTGVLPGPGRFESLGTLVEETFPTVRRSGLKSQVVGGLSYQRLYNDNDTLTVGAEYFYNPLGYSSPEAYPGLVLPRTTPLRDPATFFYLGRHYGALFVNVPAPYTWDYTTFTLSTLGNLSDQSFISRLDYALTILTHLRFEAFVAVRYGRTEGEFRFGVEELKIGNRSFSVQPGILDLGLGLRIDI